MFHLKSTRQPVAKPVSLWPVFWITTLLCALGGGYFLFTEKQRKIAIIEEIAKQQNASPPEPVSTKAE